MIQLFEKGWFFNQGKGDSMCNAKQIKFLVARNTEAVKRDVQIKDLIGAQNQGLHYIADPRSREMCLNCHVDDLGLVGPVNPSEVEMIC